MNQTFSIELTQGEIQDIRIALMDYRSKWFDLYMKGVEGKMPQNFSVKGAGGVYDDVVKLQNRFAKLDPFPF
jgi:hypothetical protein